MGGGLRRRMLVVLFVLALVASSALLWRLYHAPDRKDLAAYGQLVVAAAALLVSIVGLVRGSPVKDSRSPLDRLADQLADAVREQWRREASERGLVEPAPIEVRWRRKESAALPASAAAASARYVPHLPGATASWSDAPNGTISGLYDLYAGLRRMLIYGPAGSGKSAAAVILVRAALKARADVRDPRERADVPVPVLLTSRDWIPGQPVAEWLILLLRETYRGLPAGRRGDALLAELLERERVAVVIDGLDELRPEVRDDLVEALSRSSGFRLVVLSRTDAEGVDRSAAILDGATAVELQPVGAVAVADYLERVQWAPPPPRWGELIEDLRANPDGPVAHALQRPLQLTLLRDGYRRDDAALGVLLDSCTARTDEATRRALEARLIDGFLPRVYGGPDRDHDRRGGYDPVVAQRTLRVVASLMDRDTEGIAEAGGAPALAWWRIPARTSVLPRMLAVGVVSALAVWSGLVLISDLGQAGLPTTSDALFGLVAAVGAALGVRSTSHPGAGGAPARWHAGADRPTLMLGLGFTAGFLVQLALLGHLDDVPAIGTCAAVLGAGLAAAGLAGVRSRAVPRRRGLLDRSVVMSALGFVLGAATAVSSPLLGVEFQFGGLLGVCALAVVLGLRLALGRGSEKVVSPLAPLASWQHRRMRTLIVWFGIGPPAGGLVLVPAVVVTPNVVDSPATGVGFAFLAGLVLGLTFPETWATSLACVELAVRHRIPVRLMRFLDDARGRGVLRTTGPLYQFRHATLYDSVTRSDPPDLSAVVEAPDGSGVTGARTGERFLRAAYGSGSARVEGHRRATAERTLRLAATGTTPVLTWWQLPGSTPASPRAVAVGVVGGLATWLGFALLYPAPPILVLPVAAAGGIGAVIGYLAARARRPHPAPWSHISRARSSTWFAVGVLLGLMLLDEAAGLLTSTVVIVLSFGLAVGLLIWALVWAALRLSLTASGRAARARWRAVRLPPLPFGLALGFVVVIEAESLSVPDVWLYKGGLVPALVLLVAGLRLGLQAPEVSTLPDEAFDPLTWRRRAVPEFLAWFLLGGLATGYLARGVVRVGGDLSRQATGGLIATIVVAAVIAGVAGFGLGLLCPATCSLALASTWLAMTDRTPIRLLRFLQDARQRGILRWDGRAYAFRHPTLREWLARDAGPTGVDRGVPGDQAASSGAVEPT